MEKGVCIYPRTHAPLDIMIDSVLPSPITFGTKLCGVPLLSTHEQRNCSASTSHDCDRVVPSSPTFTPISDYPPLPKRPQPNSALAVSTENSKCLESNNGFIEHVTPLFAIPEESSE